MFDTSIAATGASGLAAFKAHSFKLDMLVPFRRGHRRFESGNQCVGYFYRNSLGLERSSGVWGVGLDIAKLWW
jgi:hypothetical protein